jgi:thiol:disulfide interchange protein
MLKIAKTLSIIIFFYCFTAQAENIDLGNLDNISTSNALKALSKGSNFSSEQGSQFKSADEVFILSAIIEKPNFISIYWQISPKYYLYRHSLDFKLLNNDVIKLGKPQIPDGKKKHDIHFGDIETYYHDLIVKIPVSKPQSPQKQIVDLQVFYQGCADDGFCYPPMSKILTLDLTELKNMDIKTSINEISPKQSIDNDKNIYKSRYITLLLAIILIILAIYMKAIDSLPMNSSGWLKFRKGIAFMILVYGIILLFKFSSS